MKFAGPGCILDGVRQRDGGCQCNHYCGYKCYKGCHRDSQCFWDWNELVCKNKKTNATGVAIPVCNEEPTPIIG